MNHVTTNEYMLEGLQERIDRLAYKIWSKKYEKELEEKENHKIFNEKYAKK